MVLVVERPIFLLTIIEALLRTNADLYILDPKNADLADLGTVMGNVYHTKDDMIDCVNAFYEGMVTRSEEMKLHPNYRTGKTMPIWGLLHNSLSLMNMWRSWKCSRQRKAPPC